MTKEVSSISELKAAMKSDANEIITRDGDLVKKLKAVKLAKSWGPAAVGGIIASVPLVITTGPVGAGAVAAFAGVATSTIVTLIVAVGGTIAISLFSDWEYVEIGAGGIKMKRKKT
ncbi:hypothetical protein [Gynuella sunshinyii]|uniref:Uncharacterized protein n=1 Tax=Gynuella sunshinyii YC6258 TaxID=1445510 RepID=A0A0C5VN91_9GAMM|nr:hypothetical protein [Gynuella sunshinyii]AJQ95756.1 hypothetical Protein YC6258_03720 [Gynuella sunshinyii YC6258]